MLHGALVNSGTFHTNQEVILVVNEEYEHVLAETVILWGHVMLRMRENTRLEDGGEIGRCHLVHIGFGGEDCK